MTQPEFGKREGRGVAWLPAAAEAVCGEGQRVPTSRTESEVAPLPCCVCAEGFELYDLNADPHEVDNLFDRAPRSLIAALQGQLSLLKVGGSGVVCWVSAAAGCFGGQSLPLTASAAALRWGQFPEHHALLERVLPEPTLVCHLPLLPAAHPTCAPSHPTLSQLLPLHRCAAALRATCATSTCLPACPSRPLSWTAAVCWSCEGSRSISGDSGTAD